mmetsp:Transcript_10993/g.29518  ORF Transcript_10993/g.29518 Transcript_10993/m.29518 type:complete len:202 (-) Transcript_10993:1121-1726(-)
MCDNGWRDLLAVQGYWRAARDASAGAAGKRIGRGRDGGKRGAHNVPACARCAAQSRPGLAVSARAAQRHICAVDADRKPPGRESRRSSACKCCENGRGQASGGSAALDERHAIRGKRTQLRGRRSADCAHFGFCRAPRAPRRSDECVEFEQRAHRCGAAARGRGVQARQRTGVVVVDVAADFCGRTARCDESQKKRREALA